MLDMDRGIYYTLRSMGLQGVSLFAESFNGVYQIQAMI